MMGQLPPPQNELFHDFSLEQHAPQNHLLRAIDAAFDLRGLRDHFAPYYSDTGCPSVDLERHCHLKAQRPRCSVGTMVGGRRIQ
jgi:hypothetical protein